MGLSKEAAEKIIKGVQNQHVISNLQVLPSTAPCSYFLPYGSVHFFCRCQEGSALMALVNFDSSCDRAFNEQQAH